MKVRSQFLAALLLLPVAAVAEGPEAGGNLGSAGTSSGTPARAISAAERGAIYAAVEYYNNGDYTGAAQALEKIIGKYPESYDGHYYYAASLVQVGRYPEAREVFEWLIARDGADYRVLNNYAWMLATASEPGLRNSKRALDLAQEAILHAPASAGVWNTLAEAHYVNANFDRAVKAMEYALELISRDASAQAKIPEYRTQLDKMRRAADVMQLLE